MHNQRWVYYPYKSPVMKCCSSYRAMYVNILFFKYKFVLKSFISFGTQNTVSFYRAPQKSVFSDKSSTHILRISDFDGQFSGCF